MCFFKTGFEEGLMPQRKVGGRCWSSLVGIRVGEMEFQCLISFSIVFGFMRRNDRSEV
jgi:hypothetical protein